MYKQRKLLEMLQSIPADDIRRREQTVTLMVNTFKARRGLWLPGVRRAYGDMIFAEFERIADLLPRAVGYRETDTLCCYADALVELMMLAVKSPSVPSLAPEKQTAIIERLRTLINSARVLEYAIDDLFEREGDNKTVTEYDIQQVLDIVCPMADQYHRNVFLRGLMNYSDRLSRMTLEAEQVVQGYLKGEMIRLRYVGDAMTDDEAEALELAADLCAFVLNDDILAVLHTLPALGRGNISFFVLYTLVGLKQDIPDGLIDTLAQDAEWANGTKTLLTEHDMGDLFPAAFDDPIHLAKACLVHWLTYPTELGQRPDDIEYIADAPGRTPADTYRIFRYRSHSETLDEDRRGVWLVGWTSADGHSFSNFDKLSDIERDTPEKTAGAVRKRLIK